MKKVLVIGGVAGGASAAARLRRLDEEVEIIMFEKGPYISFANCGLPYYIGEVIKDRDKLIVTKEELMKDRFNIDVRSNSEVIEVDSGNKVVKVKNGDKVYEESFDYLVLSPGAKPIVPKIKGIEDSRIKTLRNIPDTDKIKAEIDSDKVKRVTVIGGGYIGIEMAENLRERGLDVTLVEAAPHILAPLDDDMVVLIEKELENKGIKLILKDGVKEFKGDENSITAILNSNIAVEGDLVILAIGVTPDTEFLKSSGIELGVKGHILVDQYLETNIKGIYAAGDAVEVVDFVNKNKTAIPLAGPANKMGRIIADNICGYKNQYKDTQGTSVIKVFDLTAASTGNNERTLNKFNIPYKIIYVHPNNHAAYYPDATQMTLKLIFNDEGKILGAQAVGYDGIEKRIDVIATVLRLGGTVYDLTELELSYAPPYSSAKDPVNFAGYIAENVLSGKSHIVLPREVDARDREKVVLIDVRTKMERDNGYIDGSIHIDVNELRDKISELDKSKEYWIHCAVGLRAYIAERMLKNYGFNVKNVIGGYKSYKAEKFVPKKFINNQENQYFSKINHNKKEIALDVCGLNCPNPLINLEEKIKELSRGEILTVKSSDTDFQDDVKSFCERNKCKLIHVEIDKGIVTAKVEKF
ncbi:UDP-glucose/GDP-mannose dehydrogenase family, NAD binding domain protein [Clostridium argentinense CDC 2741]|uniref:UDP-glucose/GDP-mannose dehydrogenase family, NAD binding domain protein n=1 Tax=Clostridium argentinense CDC 2741 TaxID=1418104 RepID=A0A0C1UM86_9CLOT|nr:pyridine nucleotide-disulfide oxidoreductase [Clostridium argentinense]KIE48345.1 UDP-glucose/GDP-mannose dehydrogenase family, NAD binding domain protein [Clostridium argentinense CDC 2741]NFF41562.1 pyridine nucleotide-disulfide oxidoreductase [Clostridium argentinense]NFP52448.1 pyridine nucleotide-disulfide oxidoreductase [Clostridium argentinense]NFP74750.1 pyridine nucleotide-disulfide oxidoreductase [Clostridium argentinense]